MTQLNSEQQAAVAVRSGFYVIVAVPGSGKTRVTTERVLGLLAAGVPPGKILVCTFTKEAAKEMETRCGFKRQPGDPRIFRTFHGWCLDFVTANTKEFPFELQHFPLLTSFEQFKVMGGVMRSLPRPSSGKKLLYRDVMEYISRQKRNALTPQDAMREATGEWGKVYAQAYARYEAGCKAAGKMDFDSLLVESVLLLESRKDILDRVRPDYLLCDEAQDNDRIQWRLIKLLGAGGNIFCVGDPDQNMYSWRGAEADGLTTGFESRFPAGRVLPLAENYRSTEEIIAYLNKIKPSHTVVMRCGRKTHGPLPIFRKFDLEEQEAAAIMDDMIEPELTAILTRTNRQLKQFEELCGERDIKYKLLGKSGFYHQEEVENVVALAQYFVNPSDACVKRIISAPYDDMRHLRKKELIEALMDQQRGSVGRVSLGALLTSGRRHVADPQQNQYANALGEKLLRVRNEIGGKTAENALRYILATFGVLNYYEDDEDVDNNPADNVRSLLRIAEKRATLLDFVSRCLKAKQASRSTAKRLTLSTIHQAKGKEWKAVYVAGVNLDVLPHKSGEIREEERIYFVGCSRAEYKLHVSCTGVPSQFIKPELPLSSDKVEVDYVRKMYEIANEVAQ